MPDRGQGTGRDRKEGGGEAGCTRETGKRYWMCGFGIYGLGIRALGIRMSVLNMG